MSDKNKITDNAGLAHFSNFLILIKFSANT